MVPVLPNLKEEIKRKADQRNHFFKNFDRLVKNSQTIVFFTHVGPDGDCIGASNGLKLVLQGQYPGKRFFVTGEDDGLFPFLNPKLDTLPSDLNYEEAMAIVVDCGTSKRVFNFDATLGNPMYKFGFVVKIDHHENATDFDVDLAWDDRSYAANCCQMVQLCDYYGWKISREAATYLYLGIYTDTGRYLFDSTLPRTLVLSAKLWRDGANYTLLNRDLNNRTFEQITFGQYILANSHKGKGVLWFYIDKAVQAKFPKMKTYRGFVNTLSNIEDYKIWIMFRDDAGEIACEIRSLDVTVNQLATKFGGGGHANAAGCRLHSTGDMDKLVKDAEALVKHHSGNLDAKVSEIEIDLEDVIKKTAVLSEEIKVQATVVETGDEKADAKEMVNPKDKKEKTQ